MLRIECQSCKAPYQVDERRVPPAGLKMRCPKCGFTFIVKTDGTTEAASAAVAAPQPQAAPPPPPKPPPPKPRAPTMVGVGVSLDADLPAMKADLPAMKADLPARRAPPPVPKPIALAPPAPTKDLDDPFGKISVPGMPAVQLPPALSGEQDLPATKSSRPIAPGFGSIDPMLDLPSPVADLPSPATASLPMPRATKTAAPELPSLKAELPARVAAKKTGVPSHDIELDLPPSKPPAAPRRDSMEMDLGGKSDFVGFGEIDLPSVGDLPAVASALPAVSAGLPTAASSLPAVANQLPTVANQLPTVANQLPTVANQLPVVSNQLPMPSPSGDGFPAVANALPVVQNTLPIQRSSPPADLDIAELDLDGALSQPPPPRHSPQPFIPGAGAAPDFGSLGGEADELDLLGGGAAPPEKPRAVGGMGFGEVDLGGSSGASESGIADLIGAPPAPVPEPSASAVEALLPQQARPAKPERDRTKKPSRAPRVILGLLGVIIVAGGALQLTPYGAFGYLAISDAVRAQDYARAATDAAQKARTKLASDTFAEAKGALDELASARQRAPRSRPLNAFGAATMFAYEVRFGHDTDRDTRARQWLADVPKDQDVKYLGFARAAQEAASGNWANARKGLEAASKRDAGDPIQQDIALLRGEIELASKDAAAAETAFKAALAAQPTARAHFGLARAAAISANFEGARKEIDEVLALSPNHTGALLLRAEVRWNHGEEEKPALADVAAALDPAKDPSPVDNARGLALRGSIHAARGRAGDARNDFDAALKVDPRNVAALVGQGEVLYNEGRFTEALSRFETAVQTDKADIPAIVGSAKAKIALERLQDAKTQLSEARVAYPKDARVAYWLGKVEEALGNRAAAEHQFTSAIEMWLSTDREAILPYIALATSLLSRGEAKDSQAKLEEARSKLPDSAALQRAFGELAAAQGQYDDAVKYYQAAVERDPADVSTHFRLGSTYRRMGKMTQAADQFDQVVASDKDYPGLALERGLLFEQSGDVEKALEQFKNALAKAPNDPDLQVRVGAAYVAIGHADDALPMLRKVLEARGTSAEANHYLGRALMLKGVANEQESMRFLRRAVELDPHRAEFHLYLGWAANQANPAQLGLARDELEKALEQDKLLADAYWQRGVLQRKQAAVDNAIKDLKRALELKPTRVEAHATLGECYEDKQDFQTALAEWKTAITANDKVPFWRYRYGRLLLDRHNASEAAPHLVFAADAASKEEPKPGWYAGAPDSAEFLAAEALRQTGKKNDAKDRYRRFLSVAPLNSPDRRDAIRALRDMGEDWNPN